MLRHIFTADASPTRSEKTLTLHIVPRRELGEGRRARTAEQHRRAQAPWRHAGHDRGFHIPAAGLPDDAGGLLLRGRRDRVHIDDERRPPEPARQRGSSRDGRAGRHRDEHHVGAGRRLGRGVPDLDVTAGGGAHAGRLGAIVGEEPRDAGRMQVAGENAADLAKADDRECRHAHPRSSPGSPPRCGEPQDLSYSRPAGNPSQTSSMSKRRGSRPCSAV